jgi:prepilin-type N-terminal cleavage/methylation domain-containing protein
MFNRVLKNSLPQPPRGGFTLIELLIVVAIIAILAAIAVPNFLEAQVRSKVSRARADLRTLATALEAYRVDQTGYPSAESNGSMKWMRWLTTPVAYIARVDMDDPFTGPAAIKDNPDTNISYKTYRYYGLNEFGYVNAQTLTGAIIPVYSPPGTMKVFSYVLFSHGPDRIRSKGSNGDTFLASTNLFYPNKFIELIYDPTNGTVSNGEILRVGGNIIGRAAPAMRLIQVN